MRTISFEFERAKKKVKNFYDFMLCGWVYVYRCIRTVSKRRRTKNHFCNSLTNEFGLGLKLNYKETKMHRTEGENLLTKLMFGILKLWDLFSQQVTDKDVFESLLSSAFSWMFSPSPLSFQNCKSKRRTFYALKFCKYSAIVTGR